MPTGYTAELMEKGESFPKFAMRCARAFGALITMRDDPMDSPIPEKFEPSDFYKKELEKSETQLRKLRGMNNEEKIVFGETKKNADIKQNEQWLKKEEKENECLQEMETKILEWIPPTSDHKELKNFMLDQIKISKNDLNYIRKLLAQANSKTPMSYYISALQEVERSIVYDKEEYKKEIERVNSRTEWVKQLRLSLK